MLAVILALLLEGHEAAAATAEHGGSAHGAEGEPWLVEQVNHILGPLVLSIERAIMPSIYGLFGSHWQEPPTGGLIIPVLIMWTLALSVYDISGIFIHWLRLSY